MHPCEKKETGISGTASCILRAPRRQLKWDPGEGRLDGSPGESFGTRTCRTLVAGVPNASEHSTIQYSMSS